MRTPAIMYNLLVEIYLSRCEFTNNSNLQILVDSHYSHFISIGYFLNIIPK